VTVYLDTSTVLRVLLRQPKPLAIWARWERAYASELVHVEACRVIDRLRLGGALDDQGVAEAREQLGRIEDAIAAVTLSRAVLERAALPMATAIRPSTSCSSMATAVKTLDAIHLASALLLRERRGLELSFATHDPQQARAARALGFDCLGV
jgi:predicted nucleic acid-binding protein